MTVIALTFLLLAKKFTVITMWLCIECNEKLILNNFFDCEILFDKTEIRNFLLAKLHRIQKNFPQKLTVTLEFNKIIFLLCIESIRIFYLVKSML